jgi:hypothetical protein
MMRRLLTRTLTQDPTWVQLSVQPVGDRWAGMLLADGVAPPGLEEPAN